MCRIRMIPAVFAAIVLAASLAIASDAPTYNCHVVVRDTANGTEATLVDSNITLHQGQPATLSVTTEGVTCSFDLLVSAENQRVVTVTKTRITTPQDTVNAPQLTALLNQAALAEIGTMKIEILTQLPRAKE